MKKLLIVLAVGMALALPLGSSYAVESFRLPTELIHYDRSKAQDGYFLLWPMQQKAGSVPYKDPLKTLYLIDTTGNVVHTWPGINVTAFLYPDGNIYNPDADATPPAWFKMDWGGNKTVLFPASSQADHKRIWNPKLKQYTYIGTVNASLSKAEIVAAGGDPSLSYTGAASQTLYEWDKTGTVIWQWRFIDHVIQDRNPAWPNYVGAGQSIKDYPGKLNLFHVTDANAARNVEGVTSDWQHVNSEDYNEGNGLIAINSKHWSEFYVMDHDNTFIPGDPAASIALAKGSKGDFVYRFGKPSAYGQGLAPGFQTEGNQNLYGAHDVQWIRPYHWERPHPEAGDNWIDPAAYDNTPIADHRLPGAGNFLIFSNGVYDSVRAQSRILEINPLISGLDKEGKPIIGKNYVWPYLAGFKSSGDSNQIVWSFSARTPNSFFSQSQSGLQRLPNGNTFVCSANHGHLFQVTQAGEVVWEYVNPWNVYEGAQKFQLDANSGNFGVFRAYWYTPNYPALTDKSLIPKGTITGRPPSPIQ